MQHSPTERECERCTIIDRLRSQGVGAAVAIAAADLWLRAGREPGEIRVKPLDLAQPYGDNPKSARDLALFNGRTRAD